MKTFGELVSEYNELETPANVAVWMDRLLPEERRELHDHAFVGFRTFTEPHEETRRAAEARVLGAAESDGSVDGLFGADGFGGVLSDATDAGHPIDEVCAAFAAGKAHTAYTDAQAGGRSRLPSMNVVITLGDAARTFAYRALNGLARKLYEIAERVAPSR